jgi:hypothetical protein
MRLLALLVAASFATSAMAQSTARPRPSDARPLEEPPPPIVENDPAGEQQVTVRTEDGQTVQEYRVRGTLFMMRVTPKHGRPYVLIDHKGDGQFARGQDTLDNGVRVPQWVLVEF